MQKKYQEHGSALKEILKSYRANPIDGGPAKIMSTGVETCPQKLLKICLKLWNKETRCFSTRYKISRNKIY